MKIHGVILAADRGARMGGKTPRLLLLLPSPEGPEPILRRAVRNALGSRLERVFVVLGHEEEAHRTALAGLDTAGRLVVLANPLWAEGHAISLLQGIESAVAAGAEAVCLLHADRPRVSPPVIDRTIAALEATAAPFAFPLQSDGRRGYPVVVRAGRLEEFLDACAGDGGEEGFWQARGREGACVPLDEEETLQQRAVEDAADYTVLVAEIARLSSIAVETSPAPPDWTPPVEAEEEDRPMGGEDGEAGSEDPRPPLPEPAPAPGRRRDRP